MSRSSTGNRWLGSLALQLRWSGRDLRARWLQVIAIALVIAIGTGAYAGLSSLTRWRKLSTDAGYEQLNMFDLRVRLAHGAVLPRGSLADAVRRAAGSDLADVEERFVGDIQVDASTPDEAVIVAGAVYGLDLSDDGPSISRPYTFVGRELASADAGAPVVLLERTFSRAHDLPSEGLATLTGGLQVRYVGQATSPEHFVVLSERGGLLSEASYAVVFTSIETAALLAGSPGAVNDAVVDLAPGADHDVVRGRLEAALPGLLAGTGVTVTTRDEDPSFRINDRDISGDQQMYDILAVMIFGGAAVAAFNLTARIVEAQRREIGVAMSLGVHPLKIATRPLLVGAEIALLGVAFGIGVGIGLGAAVSSALVDLQPLPEWDTSLQVGVFARVAAIGFALPFIATTWPVFRAVRVAPVDAIRAGYRSARGWGWVRWFRWLRPPGNTFWQVPVRNVIRAPRRTLLTAIGVASAVAILVTFMGMIDSFVATVDRADRETLSAGDDRVEVSLAGYLPAAGSAVDGITRSPVVGRSDTGLRFTSILAPGDDEIGVQVELLDGETALWKPTISSGGLAPGAPGILVSELAAKNLGLAVGDLVVLRHPVVGPDGVVSLAETALPVAGTHPHPFRFLAYMDRSQAGTFGLEGMVNLVQVDPAPGASLDDVKRDLSVREGVAVVQGVGEITAAIRDTLDQFVGILRVFEAAVLLLALLIAFNSASINVDERAREHATMFAFGVRIRTVMRMAVVENLLLGLLATAMGLLGGWWMLGWILGFRIPETLPDIYIPPFVTAQTLAVAFVLGVVAVSLAPLLTWRRLSRMDVPGGLKVME